MSKMLIPAVLAALAVSLVASGASAMGFLDTGDYSNKQPGAGSPTSVPELAIGAAGGALIVIAGGAAVLAGRRRRRSPKP